MQSNAYLGRSNSKYYLESMDLFQIAANQVANITKIYEPTKTKKCKIKLSIALEILQTAITKSI